MGSCPSVGGAPGDCPGAPRDRCHTPSFPSKWPHWSPPPSQAGRLATCWGREEKHLPAGMRKERRRCPGVGGGGVLGPLLGLLALCALSLNPHSGCFPGPQPCCGHKTMTKPVVSISGL